MAEREKSKSHQQRRRAKGPLREAATGGKNMSYNPGQICLLLDLLREFADHVEVAHTTNDEELAISLTCDLPFLETFIDYKICKLQSEQQQLARLWARSNRPLKKSNKQPAKGKLLS
ncbi:MAG: hypothetical protein HY692_03900 [Cyanobacteria bacterium NC_groundwater_1444_Ag_S-0.65um_54_12]|nr:hypothetical protein [Cyanobacteria bacterium NC_groundwater_1444_Ag_S-0.65um_54_12]